MQLLLSSKTLSLLAAGGLKYNRQAVQPSILHFSLGNFHRAHQASYYNDLLEVLHQEKNLQDNENHNHSLKWGIVGASVRDSGTYTQQTRPALVQQDHLYTLVETHSSHDNDTEDGPTTIIGSILNTLPYQDDHGPIREILKDESIRIASMTVTEGGYFLNPSTNQFDPDAEAIQHDVQNPDHPQTVFGLIIPQDPLGEETKEILIEARNACGEVDCTEEEAVLVDSPFCSLENTEHPDKDESEFMESPDTDVVVWCGGAAAREFGCRGWNRSDDEFEHLLRVQILLFF